MGVITNKKWPGDYVGKVETASEVKRLIANYNRSHNGGRVLEKNKQALLDEIAFNIEHGALHLNCSIKPLLEPEINATQTKFLLHLMQRDINLKIEYTKLDKKVMDALVAESKKYTAEEYAGLVKVCGNIQLLNNTIIENLSKTEKLEYSEEIPLVEVDSVNQIFENAEKARQKNIDLARYFDSVNRKLVEITYAEQKHPFITGIIEYMNRDKLRDLELSYEQLRKESYEETKAILLTVMSAYGADRDAYQKVDKMTPLEMIKMASMYNDVVYAKHGSSKYEEKVKEQGLQGLRNSVQVSSPELAAEMNRLTKEYFEGKDATQYQETDKENDVVLYEKNETGEMDLDER